MQSSFPCYFGSSFRNQLLSEKNAETFFHGEQIIKLCSQIPESAIENQPAARVGRNGHFSSLGFLSNMISLLDDLASTISHLAIPPLHLGRRPIELTELSSNMSLFLCSYFLTYEYVMNMQANMQKKCPIGILNT